MVVRPIPHRSPHPDASVRKLGKNSARWRSPAPGSTPKRSNSSSFTRQFRSTSPLVQSGPARVLLELEAVGDRHRAAAPRSGPRRRRAPRAAGRTRRHRRRRARSRTGGGSHRRRSAVRSRKLTSSSRLSRNWVIVISWHRPTVFSGVSRVRARQIVVIGLVRFSTHASGQRVGHVGGDVEEDRDVAQRPQHPARADGVTDRLPHAMTLRDLEIVAHRREAAGGDVDHDEVGAVERGPRSVVPRCGERRCRARRRGARPARPCAASGDGIDVVEHDLGVAQRGRVDEVDEQLRRPLVAARHR